MIGAWIRIVHAHKVPWQLQAAGASADGTHGSNVAVILKTLTEDKARAEEAHKYNMVKFVTELSLEELMAGQLSGVQARYSHFLLLISYLPPPDTKAC